MCLNDSTKRHAHNFKDLTGQRFGRLIVISYFGHTGHETSWLCKCDCGTEKPIRRGDLYSGRVLSCGCLNAENRLRRNTTHGMRYSPEHATWSHMVDRCRNPRNKNYADYGGRNITVCQRWIESFANFYADMKDRPSKFHTLDRIDNERGYSPDNCRWATRLAQSNNTRRNLYITHDNETHSLADWARITGIPYDTLYARIATRKWSPLRAFNTPVRNFRHASDIA